MGCGLVAQLYQYWFFSSAVIDSVSVFDFIILYFSVHGVEHGATCSVKGGLSHYQSENEQFRQRPAYL